MGIFSEFFRSVQFSGLFPILLGIYTLTELPNLRYYCEEFDERHALSSVFRARLRNNPPVVRVMLQTKCKSTHFINVSHAKLHKRLENETRQVHSPVKAIDTCFSSNGFESRLRICLHLEIFVIFLSNSTSFKKIATNSASVLCR